VAGGSYRFGLSQLAQWWLGISIGWFLVSFFVIVPAYRSGVFTNAEWLEFRFGPLARVLAVIINTISRANVTGNMYFSIFLVLNLVAGIALGFLNPDFGFDVNSLVLAVAFTLSLIVMSVGWSLPAAIGIHRRTGEWGKLNFLPGTLLVSIVMVVICRRLEIQPGYFYGALAGLAFASALNKQSQGRLVAANWTWALAVSLASWFFRMPVSEAAAQPDASLLWIGLEAFLVMTFLWGVETLAVAMLPMRFLDGPKVKAWNRWVWAALLFAGVFITVHVLLAPTSGYVGQTETEVAMDVVVVFLVFCAVSVATWAYFRYRPVRWIPSRVDRSVAS
jgi:hypothetical protein